MNDIHADTVAKRKLEEERLGFLRSCVVAAFRAGTITGFTTDSPPELIVTAAEVAWDAIERSRKA